MNDNPTVALAIQPKEVELIEYLVNYTRDLGSLARPDIGEAPHDVDFRDALVGNLYTRAGAAAASGGKTVPMFASEIAVIEKVRKDIDFFNGYVTRDSAGRVFKSPEPVPPNSSSDPAIQRTDELLRKLRLLTGRAKAVAYRDGVAVFRTVQ